MSEKAIKKTKLLLLALLGVVIISTLVIWGCGTKGYDNPAAVSAAKYYANDATVNTMIDPATVNRWVTQGNKTDDGKRVVILDVFPNDTDTDSWFAGDSTLIKQQMITQYGGTLSPQYKMIDGLKNANLLGHIPGAIPQVSHAGYEVATRNDGPIETEHEVGTGAYIDQMLQKLGVNKDDVLVLTTSRYDYPGFCSARLFWTLYYWGFSRNNIKVLNGGNKAYAQAGFPLETGKVISTITPSTFSVTQLGQKHLDARISIGEMIQLVDSGATNQTTGSVVVLDTRQPPAAYYFLDQDNNGIPDAFEIPGYTMSKNSTEGLYFVRNSDGRHVTLSELLFKETTPARVAFSGSSNPPITLPNAFIGITAPAGPNPNGGVPLSFPLGNKAAAFEGIIKGAKVTKTGTYNITVPSLCKPDGVSYLDQAAMKSVFATAGIDGSKPIVVYCNSGALASIYYYALHEVCGFQNVKIYDGSWLEWANMAAYEPTDPTYVMNDDYTAYPSYPAPSPSVVFYAASNKYLEWDGTQFVDSFTKQPVNGLVKKGGALGGNTFWDTAHRSEHVMFRPLGSLTYTMLTSTPNSSIAFLYNNKTYSSLTDWAPIVTHPAYSGAGSEINNTDKAYTTPAGASSGSSGPAPFIPKGGGC
ncbi:sulfurtransferase [Geotalea uraniireducens]|uniref:Sulfurtransferase n=1 Tax=Geotalea uraniireducens (strain Rf4) TaxID=351605 RepID=A5GCP1_GEOUR|nr:rhodanese-like domain-containing protein [Geotalea uraniireducens]ABQ24660.1 Rhodanese domain protein [Geotalea uraniireducens Rf4]